MEYHEPEEGIDYVANPNGPQDPREINHKALTKSIK